MSCPRFDVIVIGAGPAGALAALKSAQSGRSVLLLERSSWPRDKVCGGCIARAGVSLLKRHALDDVLVGSAPLTSIEIRAGRRRFTVSPPRGAVIDRRALDARLVEAAERAGVVFQSQRRVTEIPILPDRSGRAVYAGLELIAEGRAIIDARGARPTTRTTPRLIGFGTICCASQAPPLGTLVMSCNSDGYAGMVQLADARVDIAAALTPSTDSRITPAQRTLTLVRSSDTSLELDRTARWHGAPAVECSAPAAEFRMFRTGDAVFAREPWTGQGITWALALGCEAGELAAQATARPKWPELHEREWEHIVERAARQRTNSARIPVALARRPTLIEMAAPVLSRWPKLASPIINGITTLPADLARAGSQG